MKLIKMTININKHFECIKSQGKPGDKCGKQCVWFSDDSNKFIICKFFKLNNKYAVFKM